MASTVMKNTTVGFISPFFPSRIATVRNHQFHTAKRRFPQAKLKVEVLKVGKRSGKDAVYDSAVQEYVKRMSHTLAVTERVIKSEAAYVTISDIVNRNQSSVILLDEHGSLPRDSVHFSKTLFDALEQGGSRLAIAIGSAEGLPKEVVQLKAPRIQLISLSPLTFTHKMVRLFLYEQLYRATEIRANSNYHK